MKTIVTNSSIGDAIAYSYPILINKKKSHVISFNQNVEKIFKHMPFVEKGHSDKLVFTGAPGWGDRTQFQCRSCSKEKVCLNCGRNPIICNKILKNINEKSEGEWYGFRNISDYKKPTAKFRPKKIIEAWNLNWQDRMMKISLEWYCDYIKNFKCNHKTVLFNLSASTPNRSLPNSLISEFEKEWDVRLLDCNIDIRTNLFLISQAKHIVTTDTSTYWLAKFLNHKRIHLISPGGLKRHLDLGCHPLLKDDTTSNKDIDTEHLLKAIKKSLLEGLYK